MKKGLELFWLHAIRTYLRIGLFFYFKKVEHVNQDALPKHKPVLFLANHQNALIDALLIATKCGRFSYFLTRAAVFKKPLVSKILHSLRMFPVYRIRDGWNTLTHNNSVFNNCSVLLHKGEAVTIFPEGSHNIKRTVRPLSKGFTRIVFDTLEKYPNTDLQLVPIGFNFEKAEGFPSQVAVYYGKAISAKAFLDANRNIAVNRLKTMVHAELTQLTTHIPIEAYESTLERLEGMGTDFLNPKAVNACIANDLLDCQFNRPKKSGVFGQVINVLFVCGLIAPYGIWKIVVKPKIDEVEFVSTFRFAIAITVVPMWLLFIAFMLFSLYGWHVAIGVVLIILTVTLLRVKA
ncbi:lysophospholipid acyltransferase family protein [Aestuariivivens insulae]|uniref:lysophospholipid acyltransferase family protein n=1 Tax=Aestuariivivens insulae TaxID=1621988 RepID=UPI001F59EE49|nr:lysophospholipid acyltransferase family protein [Aestuariivivens insulae]